MWSAQSLDCAAYNCRHPTLCHHAGRGDMLYGPHMPPRPAGPVPPRAPPGFPPAQAPPGFPHQLSDHPFGQPPGHVLFPGSAQPPGMLLPGMRGPEQRQNPLGPPDLPRPAGAPACAHLQRQPASIMVLPISAARQALKYLPRPVGTGTQQCILTLPTASRGSCQQLMPTASEGAQTLSTS